MSDMETPEKCLVEALETIGSFITETKNPKQGRINTF